MQWLTGIISGILTPVAAVLSKRIERKQARDTIKGKAVLAKQKGDTSITLEDAEWEVVVASQMRDSWKDEYALLLITSPYVCIVIGAIYAAFTGDTKLLEGSTAALAAMALLGVDWGELLLIVILSSFGLKFWRL